MSKNNFARIVAGLGAVAGGYMQGKRRYDESERDAERFEREREEAQLKKDERQAAASTLARAGTQTGEAVSGEDALVAGNQALADAMSRATSPEEKATVQQQYAPTIEALTAQRGTAATPGTTYTPEQAQGDYVRKMYSIDPAKAQQAEATQMQLEEGRDKADNRRTEKLIDTDLRAMMKKNSKQDEEGNDILDDNGMSTMFKARTLLAMKHGRPDIAEKTALDGMQYNTRRIQSETVQRVADADKALALFDKNPKAALDVYNKYVPDGSTATDVIDNKDGSVTVKRISSIDGTPLSSEKFESRAALRATVESMKDPNAVINHVERTFKRDIEVRKVKADESRAGSAALVAQTGVDREKRADNKEDALNKASSEYQTALDAGNAKDIKRTRAALVAAGGKVDKLEAPKGEFKPNPMGMGGTAVQTNPDGSMLITPVATNAKGPVSIAATGTRSGAAVTPKTKADFDALDSGTVYIDPDDGKRYVKP
jgi:hypothetical protein